jgi:hypothetical protein
VLSASEIARGTQGALGFLQRDPAAVLQFENTPEACLRSFRVMGLVAPVYALSLLISYSNIQAQADELEILLAEALRYVVNWLLFPVIFFEVARRRGWVDRYPRYISALNWINLPAVIVLLASVIVANIAPSPLPGYIELGRQVLFFYWFLVTTRLALGVGWLIAGMLMLVDWVPSLLLSLLVNRFLGLIPIPGS